jgi:hypothetical protein
MIIPARTVLEEDPETFWDRFSEYSIRARLVSRGWFDPLLEVVTPQGVLYAFDRTLAPLNPGEQQVLLHAHLKAVQPASPGASYFRYLPRGGYRFEGFAREISSILSLFECKEVRLLLAGPPLAGWVQVELAPPLMAFRQP